MAACPAACHERKNLCLHVSLKESELGQREPLGELIGVLGSAAPPNSLVKVRSQDEFESHQIHWRLQNATPLNTAGRGDSPNFQAICRNRKAPLLNGASKNGALYD